MAVANKISEERSAKENPSVVSPWLSEAEAAAYTKFAESSLATYRCRGMGPKFYRRGKSVRYKRDDLDAWLSESGPQ